MCHPCCACLQVRYQEGRRGGEVPLKKFSLPLEKYVGHLFKSTGHSLKNLGHSQKTLLLPLVSQAGYGPACLYHSLIVSGVTNRGQGGEPPPVKLNVKTGPPLVDILIFSILLVVVSLHFSRCFCCFM